MAFAPISLKGLKNKKFNVGNPNAALANKLNVGDTVTFSVVELQEFEPETNFDGSPYSGDPMLYLICEYEGKKGYRIKVNSMECVDFIISNNKLEFDVNVRVETFTDPRSGNERKRFDLISWN